MGWATHYIAKLQDDETVSFRPRGASMKGKIESGQLCTVEPITDYDQLHVGDIVLCKVSGAQYLHLIKAIKGKRFQIGNSRGGINGWIGSNSIFGKCITYVSLSQTVSGNVAFFSIWDRCSYVRG